MSVWHNEMVEFNARKQAEAETAREQGRIPETAHGSAGPIARAIWWALRERAGHQHRIAVLAERAGTTAGTVRKYVREWSAAGYVHLDGGTARLPKGARDGPPDISYDCGGKYAYVSYTDEPEYTTIDRAEDSRNPIVTRRRRVLDCSGLPGEVELPDKRPDENLAQYYERKNGAHVSVEGTLEPPAQLPAVTKGADLPALLDAGHRALARATDDLERLRIRDGARAYQEAARVLKRTEVLVDASVLVQTAERAIARANPALAPAKAGARRGKVVATDIDASLVRKIRSAHARVDDRMFRALIAEARDSGDPLTRKLVARAGRDAAGIASPKVTHYTGNFERGTPPHIVEAARRVMGGIDLDPASSDVFNRTVGADKYYTAHEDGLKRGWFGRVLLNPPFETPLLTAFVNRLLDHLENDKVDQAVLLTNNSTDSALWQGAASHALALCLSAGRMRFLGPNGRPLPHSALQGQAILYFAREVDDGIERFTQEFRRHGTVFYPAMLEDEM